MTTLDLTALATLLRQWSLRRRESPVTCDLRVAALTRAVEVSRDIDPAWAGLLGDLTTEMAAVDSSWPVRAEWPRPFKVALERLEITYDATVALARAGDARLEQLMKRAVSEASTQDELLSLAFWVDGTVIHVPPGRQVELPLEILRERARWPRLTLDLLAVGGGATVQIIDGCSRPKHGATGRQANASWLWLGRGARVRYAALGRLGRASAGRVGKQIRLAPEAQLDWLEADLGGGWSERSLTISLAERARCVLDLVAMAGRNDETALAVSAKVAQASQLELTGKLIADGHGQLTARRAIENRSNEGVTDRWFALKLADSAAVTVRRDGKEEDDETLDVTRWRERDWWSVATQGLDRQAARALIIGSFLGSGWQTLPLEYRVEFETFLDDDF